MSHYVWLPRYVSLCFLPLKTDLFPVVSFLSAQVRVWCQSYDVFGFPLGLQGGVASPSVEVTSESELPEESSSPEGEALLAGFDRNQLNQPNPELWRARGIVKATELFSLTNCESCPAGHACWGEGWLWTLIHCLKQGWSWGIQKRTSLPPL